MLPWQCQKVYMNDRRQTDFDILIEHGIDIRGRIIYLQGEVDSENIHKFIKLIKYLDKTDGEILVVLDSSGGDVNLGFAAYDAIKDCGNPVTVKVIGVAMSMGSVILQAADVRVMSKHSRLMIHRGQMDVNGHFNDVKRAVQENDEMDKLCMAIYLSKINEKDSNFKLAQLQKMMDFDTYISSDKALDIGLIDEIHGDDD
jgi:ATP-dependent Clp endopeptidase proteolytic subunit ClpP